MLFLEQVKDKIAGLILIEDNAILEDGIKVI